MSPAAADITRTAIHGLLQLIIIYRDHVPVDLPLLPWLLTTEVCEHVFGVCRQMIKDFNMLDFQYMVPKLFIQLREAVLSNHCLDGKARASGYNHTYGDTRGINLQNLSAYPTDEQIDTAARRAHEEAESLWALLGIMPSQVYHTGSVTMPVLPSIQSWFPDTQPAGPDMTGDNESESDSWESDADEDDEATQLRKTIDLADDSFLDARMEEQANACTYAAVAMEVDERMRVCVQADPLIMFESDALSGKRFQS